MKLRSLVPLLLPFCVAASAQVTLPKVLGSHMVVQRDLPVHLWGTASIGEQVTASFRGESRSTKADRLGLWSLYLAPGSAGGPFQLKVQGSEANSQPIVLDDILVGDVWIASGQSNMEFPMSRAATAAQDLPNAGNPQIRLLMINRRASDYAQTDIDSNGWTVSSPETAKDFSAIAWYFARDISEREHVPVGVVDSTWGGTVAESWVRLTAIGADASLAPLFVSRGKMTDREAIGQIEEEIEKKQQDEARAQGKPVPQFRWHPPLNSWAPGLLWNGMIAPLTPFPIRGVIWYQGESNSALARAPLYSRIFRDTDRGLARPVGCRRLPLPLRADFKLQIQHPLKTGPRCANSNCKTLAIRNTAMAVTIDIGNPDNVHPTDKIDVGLSAGACRTRASYGESVEYSGPLFRQATPEGPALRLWFDHAQGLKAKGGEPTGFEVAGSDGKFILHRQRSTEHHRGLKPRRF